MDAWLAFGFRRQIETTLDDKGTPFGNLSYFKAPTIHDIVHAAYLAANTHALALLFIGVVLLATIARVVGALGAGPRVRNSVPRSVAIAAFRVTRDLVRDPRVMLLVAWLVVPLLIAAVLSYLATPLLQARYAIALSLPVYLAVAAAIVVLLDGTRVNRMVAVGAVVA